MKKFIVIFISILILSATLDSYAQFTADVDGSASVNPQNGNLSFVYPICNKQIKGSQVSVNLTYANNVTFSAFNNFYDEVHTDTVNQGWSKYVRVHPAWIIGANEFAVQVLSHKFRFMDWASFNVLKHFVRDTIINGQYIQIWDYDLTSGKYHGYPQRPPYDYVWNLSDTNSEQHFTWQIEGFDMCNRMKRLKYEYDQDYIKLLRADGSVLELRNPVQVKDVNNNENDERLYTGNYYPNELNTNAYAIVEYDETYWPTYFSDDSIAPSGIRNSMKPRILKYYPGNGLEYVFREHPAPYGRGVFNKTYSIRNFELTGYEGHATGYNAWLMSNNVFPTIFYMEEINNSIGNVIKTKREAHYPIQDTVDVSRGRARITDIGPVKFTYGLEALSIESFGRTIKLNMVSKLLHSDLNIKSPEESYFGYNYLDVYFNLFSFLNNQIYKNLEGEWNTPYDRHRSIPNGATGEISLVSKITDPMGREIKFSYDSYTRKYRFEEQSTLAYNFQYFRLDTIFQPSQTTTFDYYDDNEIIELWQMIDTSRHGLDYDAMNVVKEVNTFNRINTYYYETNIGEQQTSISYTFEEEPYGTGRKSTVEAIDMGTGNLVTTEYFFKKHKVTPLKENPQTPNLAAELAFTSIDKIIKTTGANKSIETTVYCRGDSIVLNTQYLSSRFFFYPIETTSSVKIGDEEPVITSHKKYEYSFDGDIFPWFFSTELKSAYGIGTSQVREITTRPDDFNTNLFTIKTDFLNIRYYIANVTRIDSVYDYGQSRTETFKQREQGQQTTAVMFSTSSFSGLDTLPPIYGLTEKISVYTGNTEEFQGAKEFEYYSWDYSDGTTYPRGALISTKVIGKDNTEVQTSELSYKTGWYRNLLNGSTNYFGAKSKLYYNYFDVPEYTQNYPVGKKMRNNDTYVSPALYHLFPEFETPLINEATIRKYDASGNIYETKLRSVKELTYFGQVANVIDPNGWLYSSEYDKNGRVQYVWHPFDFPHDGQSSGSSLSSECMPFHEYSTLSIHRADTINYYTKNISYGTTTDIKYLPNELLIGNTIGTGEPLIDEDDMDTLGSQHHMKYKATLKYYSRLNDPLHTWNSISAADLRFFMIGYEKCQCMTLKMSIPRFDYEQRITVGCPGISLLPDQMEIPEPEKTPELRFNLLPLADNIKSLPNGDSFEIFIESLSLEGTIKLVDNADDLNPAICVTGTPQENPYNDYTYHFEYNDSLRTTDYFAKIDDALHTKNDDWQLTFEDHDGRYTKSRGFFAIGNRLKRLDNYIGGPRFCSRIDSVVNYFSGFGQLGEFMDPNRNSYSTEYDYNFGRVNRVLLPDFTESRFAYNVLPASQVPVISGQDFYGVCYINTSIDAMGKKDASYSDAFGRIRRVITDSAGFNYITKYDYDDAGNLVKLTNPKGEETQYWYDEFSRVIYTRKAETDFISYAYDKIGRLRFTQTKEQAVNNKMSFIEYDDLGRTTITGEAKFTFGEFDNRPAEPELVNGEWVFSRLTDMIDPNVLHHATAGSGLYTANKTLYMTPQGNGTPVFDPDVAFKDNQIPLVSDFEDEPEPAKPYMLRKVNDYEFPYTGASSLMANFEDISRYYDFVRSAINYDEFPIRAGAIWSNIPIKSKWEGMAKDGALKNLKGRQAAAAYRDAESQPFHYVVMSYDPRGRIESLLRFTENLGFDAVYYTYNSMNQVISIKTSDPERTHQTWYSYDNNGRVDTVWTTLGAVNTGLGEVTQAYPADLAKPATPDAVYSYNKLGKVETINYIPIGAVKTHYYNKLGMLDSLIASGNYGVIFKEALARNAVGNITRQKSRHYQQTEIEQNYTWDNLQRLVRWDQGSEWQTFSYDQLGNRTSDESSAEGVTNYSYFSAKQNILSGTSNTTTKFNSAFDYNSIGSLTTRRDDVDGTTTVERFEYNAGGRLSGYTRQKDSKFNIVEPCTTAYTYDENNYVWKYRYSILGGREQKRLYYSPHGDDCSEYSHAWEYNLIGAAGELLAIYHGRQSGEEKYRDGESRMLYMYPTCYMANGGEITLRIMQSGGANLVRKEFSITDHLGSVRSVVYMENGIPVVKSYDYKPFGKQSWSNGSKSERGYAGYINEIESRYTWLGARQYDAQLGRFLSVDPLFGLSPAETPYHYCSNSPLTRIDPSGMYSRTIDVVEPVLVSAVWVDPLDSPLGPNPIDPYWVLTFNMVGRTITINIPEAAFGGGGGGGGGRAIINNSDIPLYLRMKGAPPIDQGTKDYYAKFRSIEEIQLPALESALNSEVNAGAIALAAPASVSLGEWLASSFATGGVEGLAATAMVTVGIPVLLMTILSGDSERPDNMEIAQNMVRAEALAQEQAAQAAEYERTRYRRAQWHHIATFYGYIGLQNALMFQYAGMDIKSDPNNLMYMLDHFGGHTLSYRTEVNRRLREAVTPYVNHKWLYRDALTRTLNDLRFEILSGGLKLYKR